MFDEHIYHQWSTKTAGSEGGSNVSGACLEDHPSCIIGAVSG